MAPRSGAAAQVTSVDAESLPTRAALCASLDAQAGQRGLSSKKKKGAGGGSLYGKEAEDFAETMNRDREIVTRIGSASGDSISTSSPQEGGSGAGTTTPEHAPILSEKEVVEGKAATSDDEDAAHQKEETTAPASLADRGGTLAREAVGTKKKANGGWWSWCCFGRFE